MSLWDSITSIIAPSSGGGGISGGTLLSAGVSLASTLATSRANRKAAEIAETGRREAADRIERSNNDAIRRFDTLAAEAQPGIDRLRETTVGADGLTEAQRAQLGDLRRQTLNGITAGGLAGSGRATTAALRDVENRFVLDALDRNASRGDQAAGQLARIGVGATTDSASVGRDTGIRTAGLLSEIGDINAEAGLSNAALRGAAMGDIAGVISADVKGRESRYQQTSGKKDRDEDPI